MREPREYEAPLCAEVGGDLWFPEPTSEAGNTAVHDSFAAKKICNACLHRSECAEWGINREVHGIWGGLVPRERQRIRSSRGIKIREERSA